MLLLWKQLSVCFSDQDGVEPLRHFLTAGFSENDAKQVLIWKMCLKQLSLKMYKMPHKLFYHGFPNEPLPDTVAKSQ